MARDMEFLMFSDILRAMTKNRNQFRRSQRKDDLVTKIYELENSNREKDKIIQDKNKIIQDKNKIINANNKMIPSLTNKVCSQGEEIDKLKATIDELKAGSNQISKSELTNLKSLVQTLQNENQRLNKRYDEALELIRHNYLELSQFLQV